MITYVVKQDEAYGILLTQKELMYLTELTGADAVNSKVYQCLENLLKGIDNSKRKSLVNMATQTTEPPDEIVRSMFK